MVLLACASGGANADSTPITVTAIEGTSGEDTLSNAIGATATASIAIDNGILAQTIATGMDALAGNDTLTNPTAIAAWATSLFDPLFKQSASTTDATAIGIAAGLGDDVTTNGANITAGAAATISVDAFGLLLDTLGLTDWGTLATSRAVGFDGGAGIDTFDSTAAITVTANAAAVITAVDIATIDVPLTEYAAANADNKAAATAVGITVGDIAEPLPWSDCPETNCETVTQAGSLNVHSTANATTWNFTASLTGGARLDGSIVAESDAAGIVGSALDNAISYDGNADIDAAAVASLYGGGLAGSGSMLSEIVDLFGLDAATSQTTAAAAVVGIDGGAGDDAITLSNADSELFDVYARSDATAIWVDITISVPAPSGDSLSPEISAFGSASANTTETTAYLAAGTRSTTEVTGVSGGAGDDNLASDADVVALAEASATQTSVSVDISVDDSSYLPSGATTADTATFADARATGLSSGDGQDEILNRASLDVSALATGNSSTTGVAVNVAKEGLVVGAVVTDASTTATSSVNAIDAGAGSDQVTNRATIAATAVATGSSSTESVTVTATKSGVAAGVTMADASTLVASSSSGIDAAGTIPSSGEQDLLKNFGSLRSHAGAYATGLSVGITVSGALQGGAGGAAVATGDTTAAASASGMRSGAGNDRIVNDGIDSVAGDGLGATAATAVANVDNKDVAVTLNAAWEGVALGATVTEADSLALASTVGVDTGAGEDEIDNRTGLRSNATANVSTDNIAVTVAVAPKGISAGFALSTTTTDAVAAAIGVDAGTGNDSLLNSGWMNVAATASSSTKTITLNFAEIGAAIADASSNTMAAAVGVRGGSGEDSVINNGTVDVMALTLANDILGAANLAGYAAGDIRILTSATAFGIDASGGVLGDAASNIVDNSAAGAITVNAVARALADQYVVQGGGAAFAEAGAYATGAAVGIAGDMGEDDLSNDGDVSVTATANVRATSLNFQLFGVQIGQAGIGASASASGIDGRDGANVIANDGTLDVYADVDTLAGSIIGGFSAGISSAGTTARADAYGITTGAAIDVVDNTGSITVTGSSLGQAGAGAIGLMAASVANALASTRLTGVDTGGGNDRITNTGNVTVGMDKTTAVPLSVFPLAKADTEAIAFDFMSFVFSSLGARADVTGLAGGAGDDTVTNAGSLTVGDAEQWMVVGESFGFGGQIAGSASAFAGTDASVTSIGMDGGSGGDTLRNSSGKEIAVNARSYADVDSETYVSLGFLPSNADARAKSGAMASGMRGDTGNDFLENAGILRAQAYTLADAFAQADVGSTLLGGILGEAEATASANAWGLDGGSGTNSMSNSGAITAGATALAVPWGHSNADGINHTESTMTAHAVAEAAAIKGADDINEVINAAGGVLTAAAVASHTIGGFVARATSDTDATAFAGSWVFDGATSSWQLATPVSALATGIATGKSPDSIINEGSIGATASTGSAIYASAGSNVFTTHADAFAGGLATGIGIDAGAGANNVVNSGRIDVLAAGHAQPITDATSRDQRGNSNAVANSSSGAAGIEGDGSIVNAASGELSVTARTTAYADGDSGAHTSAATATLNAIATGLGTATSSVHGAADQLRNDGLLTVLASSGAAEDGTAQNSAFANTSAWVRSVASTAITTATSDGAGIRVGNNDAEIFNVGALSVTGISHAWSVAFAYSRDYDPTAIVGSVAAANAYGIQVGAGQNLIVNDGDISIAGVSDAYVYAFAEDDSNFATERTVGVVNSNALAAGVATGDGDNHVINRGSIVVSASMYSSWLLLTEDYGLSVPTLGYTVSAYGIRTGAGDDTVEHYGSLNTAWTQNLQFGQYVLSGKGTAIATGDGGDRVVLGTISSTVGDIDLGPGADTLLLNALASQPGATPALDGVVQAGEGSDTFALGGDGFGSFDLAELAGRYLGFEALRKEGAAQWAVTGVSGLPLEIADGELSAMNASLGAATVLADGRLSGNGSFGGIVNQGVVAPGLSIGHVTVLGDYVQAPGAVLEIELGGISTFDILHVGGTANLAGTLQVVLNEEFVPELGDTFAFLTAANVFGEFDEISCMVCAGLRFNSFVDGNSLVLRVNAVPLPGAIWLFISAGLGLWFSVTMPFARRAG